jgi:hypothetical protein
MQAPRTLVAMLACGLACVGLGASADAQPVRIPGTSVTMTAPQGFKASRNPPGLTNAATGSSVVVAELPPDSYKEALAVFSSPKAASSRYAEQGIRFTRIEQLTIGAAQVPLAIGGKAENGREVRKYIAVMGGAQNNEKTTLITFSITGSDSLGQSEVETVLRSVALGRVATLDEKLARLTFKFKAVPPFHTSDVVDGATVMLATFVGDDPSAAKPIVAIARGSTSSSPAEVAQLSERFIHSMPEFKDAQVSEQKAAPFAGGNGYFMAAAAGELGIQQYLLVLPGGRFVRLFARGEPSALEEVHDAVVEIADSVELLN